MLNIKSLIFYIFFSSIFLAICTQEIFSASNLLKSEKQLFQTEENKLLLKLFFSKIKSIYYKNPFSNFVKIHNNGIIINNKNIVNKISIRSDSLKALPQSSALSIMKLNFMELTKIKEIISMQDNIILVKICPKNKRIFKEIGFISISIDGLNELIITNQEQTLDNCLKINFKIIDSYYLDNNFLLKPIAIIPIEKNYLFYQDLKFNLREVQIENNINISNQIMIANLTQKINFNITPTTLNLVYLNKSLPLNLEFAFNKNNNFNLLLN